MSILFHTFSSILGCCTLTTDQYFDDLKECWYLFTSQRRVTFIKKIICFQIRSKSLICRISAYIFCCFDYHSFESNVSGAAVWRYLESCRHIYVNHCSVATIYAAALNVSANTISALCSLLFLIGGRSKKGGGFATVSSSYKVRPPRSVLLVSPIARNADPIPKFLWNSSTDKFKWKNTSYVKDFENTCYFL